MGQVWRCACGAAHAPACTSAATSLKPEHAVQAAAGAVRVLKLLVALLAVAGRLAVGDATGGAPAPGPGGALSPLWGTAGEDWSPDGPLNDFSYAGARLRGCTWSACLPAWLAAVPCSRGCAPYGLLCRRCARRLPQQRCRAAQPAGLRRQVSVGVPDRGPVRHGCPGGAGGLGQPAARDWMDCAVAARWQAHPGAAAQDHPLTDGAARRGHAQHDHIPPQQPDGCVW